MYNLRQGFLIFVTYVLKVDPFKYQDSISLLVYVILRSNNLLYTSLAIHISFCELFPLFLSIRADQYYA